MIWQRFDLKNIYTREHLATLIDDINRIHAWARQEGPAVEEVYRWALLKFKAEAESRVKLYENKAAVEKAYESLPKPRIGEVGT